MVRQIRPVLIMVPCEMVVGMLKAMGWRRMGKLKFLPKWVDELVLPAAALGSEPFMDEELVDSRGSSGEVFVQGILEGSK